VEKVYKFCKENNTFVMEIYEIKSGLRKPVVVEKVEEKDFKILTKRRFSFRWKSLKGEADIYKLHIVEEPDILGVMGLVDVPEEKRIEIKLLANSVENRGRHKLHDRVAGCMIAYACVLASKKYEGDACLSLLPKTNLVNHYIQKYRMVPGGRQLYLERESMYYITNKYFYVSSKTEREGYPGGT
jgi:hypothetical protein